MKLEVTDTPDVHWDDFAMKYTNIIFFRSIWGCVLKSGIGAQLRYYCLLDGGKIVGGMPAVEYRLLNLKLFYSSIPYGGYIGEPSYRSIFYSKLYKRLREPTMKPDLAYFMPAPFNSEAPAEAVYEQRQTPITYVDIGGRTMADIETGFQRGVMQSVRKCRKLGVHYAVSDDERSMEYAYALYRETMRRNRAIIRYRQRWFRAVHECLIRQGLATVCTVYAQEVPIVSVISARSGQGVHLMNNGSSTEHLALRANDYMIYNVIGDAVNANLRYVDLMNSPIDDRNLIAWKEKFGGVTVRKMNSTLVNSRIKGLCWTAAKRLQPLVAHAEPFRDIAARPRRMAG